MFSFSRATALPSLSSIKFAESGNVQRGQIAYCYESLSYAHQLRAQTWDDGCSTDAKSRDDVFENLFCF